MAYRPDACIHLTNVRLDDVLTQAAKNLHLSAATVPTLPLERITTISGAISAVGSALVGTPLDKTICLSGEEEKRQRKHLLRVARLQQESVHLGPKVRGVLTQPRVGPLPDPIPATPAIRDSLRNAAFNAPRLPSPYFLTINSPIGDSNLVSVSARMILQSFEDNPVSFVFTPPLTIWDTASHSCQITENCLDPDFLAYIKNPDNEFPELAGKVQVDATIALTGNTFSMSFLALIVPAGTLPNNFKGVLLGQYTFLDQLHYEMIPQKVLHAFGTPVAEDLWGIIRIHTLLQADGSMKRFADLRAEDKSLGEGEKTSTFSTELSSILKEEGDEHQDI